MISDSILSAAHVSDHNNELDIEIVSNIERDLRPCDSQSLIFLLYDEPKNALQELEALLQRKSDSNKQGTHTHLSKWSCAEPPKWQQKLLEALATCQLYNILRRLGHNIPLINHLYPISKTETRYLDPMKKALYKLSENMCASNLSDFKQLVMRYYTNIQIQEQETCEMVLLKLMCESVISVGGKKPSDTDKYNVKQLILLLKDFKDLKVHVDDLIKVEKLFSKNDVSNNQSEKEFQGVSSDLFHSNFAWDTLDGEVLDNYFISDKPKVSMYPIKNPNRLGVCLVINQEVFTLHETNTETKIILSNRCGSSLDADYVKRTSEALKFKPIVCDNLSKQEMLNALKLVIQDEVHQEDSMFMLCILSHGKEGCIYDSECYKVRIEWVKEIIGREFYNRDMEEIPKFLIFQSCRERDIPKMQSDSVLSEAVNCHFVTCYATVSGLKAHRLPVCQITEYSSFYIKRLCDRMLGYAHSHDIVAIHQMVNNDVNLYFHGKEEDQFSECVNNLDKALYFKKPVS